MEFSSVEAHWLDLFELPIGGGQVPQLQVMEARL
jgi:hypothetical protein